MASIVVAGGTSGTVTLAAPLVAGTTTLTLPTTNGTVVVTGTTPTLNGITFPATQVPSADANTLDDYEEGTWTPVYSPASGSFTALTMNATGRYTKVGRLVTVMFTAAPNITKGAASGDVSVTGLPFTNQTDIIATGNTSSAVFWANPPIGFTINASTSTIILRKTVSSNIQVSDMNDGASTNFLSITASYYV
jgi:hypothetical protein